jgi:hypothetical protein
MADRLDIRRPLDGVLAGPLPERYGLHPEACFRIMMRQEFRLGLRRLWKLCLQHLRNPLVVLLPGALQERLIGSILNESVLEEVRSLRRHATAVEQLSVRELLQAVL